MPVPILRPQKTTKKPVARQFSVADLEEALLNVGHTLISRPELIGYDVLNLRSPYRGLRITLSWEGASDGEDQPV